MEYRLVTRKAERTVLDVKIGFFLIMLRDREIMMHRQTVSFTKPEYKLVLNDKETTYF